MRHKKRIVILVEEGKVSSVYAEDELVDVEILDVLHAADVAFLQKLPNLRSPGLLFRTAVFSAPTHSNTSDVVSLFYTTSEVYTILGIVSTSTHES